MRAHAVKAAALRVLVVGTSVATFLLVAAPRLSSG
jgi:hypothetical protein